ncbi:hypothetical protein PS862_01397 [Pseudomonas fluorescens]|uniref:Uncharacterized protein n=1 Tax=Pseudomonas fluorescens TaxID=294 RepID=A0A5E7I7S8_PSEFL|nr:hypothetical protein PS862_01397 [Pseudomonas fluorescens]
MRHYEPSLVQQHDVIGDFILAMTFDGEIVQASGVLSLASMANRISRTKSLSSFIEVSVLDVMRTFSRWERLFVQNSKVERIPITKG